MDPNIVAMLTQFGISATIIPFAGGIVKTTVDVFKGGLQLTTPQCIATCYVLSFFLVALLGLLVPLDWTPPGFILFFARTVLTGWLTANWAAMMTDTHNKAREEVVDPEPEPENTEQHHILLPHE